MSAKQTRSVPPPLPPDAIYTPCYCEENVYLLAQAFASNAEANADWPWQAFVVLISNHGKTVALWSQKAREDVVVWDYHVVLVLRRRVQCAEQDPGPREDGQQQTEMAEDAWVYDLDTRLAVPSKGTEYVANTFPYVFSAAFVVPPEYQSLFRVIPAQAYLDHFASDRSHMFKHAPDITPCYSSPPPPYAALRGKRARELGITNNLMDAYVSMGLYAQPLPRLGMPGARAVAESERIHPYGEVMTMPQFRCWLAGDALAAGENAQ